MPGYSITLACVAAWLVVMVTTVHGGDNDECVDTLTYCPQYTDIELKQQHAWCSRRRNYEWCEKSCGKCTPKPAVHGGWSSWTQVSPCTVTCGGGVYQRSRTCTKPAPRKGGRPCEGDSTSSVKCSPIKCSAFMFKNIIKDLADTISVDGVVTTWTRWGSCSSSCGGGSRTRVRSCRPPTDGGAPCSDELEQTSSCSTNRCPECFLKPNPDSGYSYLQFVHWRWVPRPCAPGTMWVTSACRCDHPHSHEGK